MVEDFTLNLHAGGRHLCTPAWDKVHDKLDQCYKVYVPVSGMAMVAGEGREFTLEPGCLYFISGYALQSQRCPVEMEVRWLHFTPVSFYLDRFLQRMPLLHAWPVAAISWAVESFDHVENLFENPSSDVDSHPAWNVSMALACRIEAALLQLIAELLGTHGHILESQPDLNLERLRPAIRHMDEHFRENPTLAEMAAKAHLAPTYFHRLFQQTMGTTPLAYITARRMAAARRLLANPRLQIKHIAEECGYQDQYYFSRAFLKHFGTPPSVLREKLAFTP